MSQRFRLIRDLRESVRSRDLAGSQRPCPLLCFALQELAALQLSEGFCATGEQPIQIALKRIERIACCGGATSLGFRLSNPLFLDFDPATQFIDLVIKHQDFADRGHRQFS